MTTDEKLDAIFTIVTNIEKRLASLTVRAAAKSSGGGEVAPDSELDSMYGDPVVKKDPPRWEGDSFISCNMSTCSPEYLDEMASFLEWKAQKNLEKGTADGDKYARYDRRDAARARGWAKRIRGGWVAPAVQEQSPTDDSEIPF